MDLEFEEELYKILDRYTQGDSWTETPLDGDEVDKLTEHIRNQLNLINGNITNEEYLELEESGTDTDVVCPLCKEKLTCVEHKLGEHTTYIYTHDESCPFIGFEYVDDEDLKGLSDYLNNRGE